VNNKCSKFVNCVKISRCLRYVSTAISTHR
jgi:hypothetical protein